MLRIVPLGGLGEVGLNAMVFESEDEAFLVDCGIMFPQEALGVDVVLPDGSRELPSPPVTHQADHGHDHDDRHVHVHEHTHQHVHGPHRHVGELLEILARAPLSPWVRERAVRAFTLLGEAEGRIHGVPAAAVALHEVGAVDALVDIVGAIEGFEHLELTRVYHRPVAVEDGLEGGNN